MCWRAVLLSWKIDGDRRQRFLPASSFGLPNNETVEDDVHGGGLISRLESDFACLSYRERKSKDASPDRRRMEAGAASFRALSNAPSASRSESAGEQLRGGV